MTEAEWLACADPEAMLAEVRKSASDRKLRLFAAACCRRLWFDVPDLSRRAVTISEAFVDGQAGLAELRDVEEVAECEWEGAEGHERWLAAAALHVTKGEAFLSAVWAARCASAAFADGAWREAVDAAALPVEGTEEWRMPMPLPLSVPWNERQAQAALARDIFLKPEVAIETHLDWLARDGGIAVGLAQAIYEECALDRLPILADALEDAGCSDGALLAHLRGPGPHVRACWALDLVLGKS